MSQISTLDIVLAVLGVGYGAVLILSAFMSNRFFEAFRLDSFFIPKPTPQTKKLNLLFGLFVLGASIYSFFSSYK